MKDTVPSVLDEASETEMRAEDVQLSADGGSVACGREDEGSVSFAGDQRPVGVMDSGLGGISVLRSLVRIRPRENFLYFGDSANAPYGEKTVSWVRDRTREIVGNLVDLGAKAVVLACNTATSAAADMLRSELPALPIVGIEPALKPAACDLPGGTILVMATPMTLNLEKFQHLADIWGEGCTVIPVACEGLAARIEEGSLEADDLHLMLDSLVGSYRGCVDGVVLGCTHYAFAADIIRSVVGNVPLYDGAEGTARQLSRMLQARGLGAAGSQGGHVRFMTSSTDVNELELYRSFLAAPAPTIPPRA